jgi:hypothetical protein
MIYPHRIRLRGPWDCVPIARLTELPDGRVVTESTNVPVPLRMSIPCRWRDGGLPDFAGRVCLKRRFGYPGRIDETERVWLTLDGVVGSCSLFLNARALATYVSPTDHMEFEVTGLLHKRNEFVVTLEDLQGLGGLTGEVAIEIRRTAFLRGVKVERIGLDSFQVTGEVVGACEGPLEIYVIYGRRNVGYATVEASDKAMPFQVSASDLPTEQDEENGNLVRVELIQGATVWYEVEIKIDKLGTDT